MFSAIGAELQAQNLDGQVPSLHHLSESSRLEIRENRVAKSCNKNFELPATLAVEVRALKLNNSFPSLLYAVLQLHI